jgi:Leu/Phe-tRNA-protein transferase
MLQQEIYVEGLFGIQCSGNDKQWWWFTDHREVQDTRLQIQSMVQQEGNNQHYLPQESHQVLQGDLR